MNHVQALKLLEVNERLSEAEVEEIGKEEIVMLLSMKPINNLNHRDWSFFGRISGWLKLKEKTIDCLES